MTHRKIGSILIDGKAVDVYELTAELLAELTQAESDSEAITTYDDLIEDQDSAIAELCSEGVL